MKYGTVIDIGSSKIMCMSVGSSADGAIVVNGVGSATYSGYRVGSYPALASLSEALRSALDNMYRDGGRRARSACIGVPAPFTRILTDSCEIPIESKSLRIIQEDIDYLVECSTKLDPPPGFELMHSTPFNFTIDGADAKLNPIGQTGRMLGASVAHVFVDSDFRKMVADALGSVGIAAGPFVSTQMVCSLFTIPVESLHDGALLLDCGGSHCDIGYVRDNALIASETVGIGGQHITNDIALGLRLPIAAADELKRRYVFGLDYSKSFERVRIPNEGLAEIDCSMLQLIIESRVDELCQLIEESLDELSDYVPNNAPIYMIGGGIALMRGGTEYISNRIGREFIVNMPMTSRMNTVNYASAFGLAQFMLYGSGLTSKIRSGSRFMNNIKEFFNS